MKNTVVKDQVYSSIVDTFNQVRLNDELTQLNYQDQYFKKAIGCIDEVRKFIGTPEKILGSQLTKHGEIAEHVEVGIRNAQRAIIGEASQATFDGVGRTAGTDYIIDGNLVQSKFINGFGNNLDHVLKHMAKYAEFKKDKTFYIIPKDHYETILKIYNGENVEGLSQKTINAIKTKITQIQTETGRSFNDVVRPSISKYAEVQQGTINQTLDKHENDIKAKNEKQEEIIRNEHKANLNEGLKATAAAAAVGASISLCTSLYRKYKKEGKNIFNGDLTKEDWKEIGLHTAKDSAIAGVTGAAVYAITNCADLSAPLAGAFVTAVKGVGSLINDYRLGKITFEEFQVDSIYLCADSAVVYMSTIAGQTLIPIPILGSIIGALSGKLVSKILFGDNSKLAKKMESSMQEFLKRIDKTYQDVVNKINNEFDKIEDLRRKAFDPKTNISIIETSIKLAQAYGVPEYKILKNETDLQKYLFD